MDELHQILHNMDDILSSLGCKYPTKGLGQHRWLFVHDFTEATRLSDQFPSQLALLHSMKAEWRSPQIHVPYQWIVSHPSF